MGWKDSAFSVGDGILNHGGQVALDLAGFIPGVNVVTEGLESAYHGAHAAHDYASGHVKEGRVHSGEALWHGGLAALNLITGEGGAAAHGAEAAAKLATKGADVAYAAGEGAALASQGGRLAGAVSEGAHAAEHVPGVLDMFGSGGRALKRAGESMLGAIRGGLHVGQHLSESGVAGGLHLAADTTEVMADGGLTAVKAALPQEEAEEVPFVGGLPGLLWHAIRGGGDDRRGRAAHE